jgi:hypothetical protein
MIFILLLIPLNSSINVNSIIKTEEVYKNYIINKDSVEYYPLPEVLAAIAYHECGNLSTLDRWLVMEAFMNRIIHNFNNNGKSVKEQLLAPKQFTGLWKYRPQDFKYNSKSKICQSNKLMAEQIITGSRATNRIIFYWAGVCDRNHSHGKWVKKKEINYQTTQWYR